jgi:hypothetical protein
MCMALPDAFRGPEPVELPDSQTVLVSLDDGLYEGTVSRAECEALQR